MTSQHVIVPFLYKDYIYNILYPQLFLERVIFAPSFVYGLELAFQVYYIDVSPAIHFGYFKVYQLVVAGIHLFLHYLFV